MSDSDKELDGYDDLFSDSDNNMEDAPAPPEPTPTYNKKKPKTNKKLKMMRKKYKAATGQEDAPKVKAKKYVPNLEQEYSKLKEMSKENPDDEDIQKDLKKLKKMRKKLKDGNKLDKDLEKLEKISKKYREDIKPEFGNELNIELQEFKKNEKGVPKLSEVFVSRRKQADNSEQYNVLTYDEVGLGTDHRRFKEKVTAAAKKLIDERETVLSDEDYNKFLKKIAKIEFKTGTFNNIQNDIKNRSKQFISSFILRNYAKSRLDAEYEAMFNDRSVRGETRRVGIPQLVKDRDGGSLKQVKRQEPLVKRQPMEVYDVPWMTKLEKYIALEYVKRNTKKSTLTKKQTDKIFNEKIRPILVEASIRLISSRLVNLDPRERYEEYVEDIVKTINNNSANVEEFFDYVTDVSAYLYNYENNVSIFNVLMSKLYFDPKVFVSKDFTIKEKMVDIYSDTNKDVLQSVIDSRKANDQSELIHLVKSMLYPSKSQRNYTRRIISSNIYYPSNKEQKPVEYYMEMFEDKSTDAYKEPKVVKKDVVEKAPKSIYKKQKSFIKEEEQLDDFLNSFF